MAEIIDKEKYGRLCQAVQQTEEDPRDQMYPRLWQLDDGNRFTTIEQFKSGSLHNIGVHYCTDKAQANRTAETSYLQIYEMYFG